VIEKRAPVLPYKDIVVVKERATAATPLAAPQTLGQVVEIQVKRPVQIRIRKDDDEVRVRDFDESTQQIFFHEFVELVVADASSVRISYNGNDLGNLGDKGETRRLTFRKNDNSEKEIQKM